MATNFTTVSAAAPKGSLVVEVADQPAKAKVVREGFQVPVVKYNPQAADFFLDNLQVVDIRQTPRVVTQSIPQGTRVLAGTVIDLVLAPATGIPLDIFENVHRDLAQRTVGSVVDTLLANTEVRQTLLKYEDPADVPESERAALTAQFNAADIAIDDSVANTSFAAAFNSARGALAFR